MKFNSNGRKIRKFNIGIKRLKSSSDKVSETTKMFVNGVIGHQMWSKLINILDVWGFWEEFNILVNDWSSLFILISVLRTLKSVSISYHIFNPCEDMTSAQIDSTSRASGVWKNSLSQDNTHLTSWSRYWTYKRSVFCFCQRRVPGFSLF